MAENSFSPKSVKDVPKDKFIAAYAAHLKANDKVRVAFGWPFGRAADTARATYGTLDRRLPIARPTHAPGPSSRVHANVYCMCW